MLNVSIESINKVTMQVLKACGVSERSSEVILDTIHYANRCGIPTHGIGRLSLYVKKIQAGYFNPKDEIETVIDSDAVTVLDAHGGFGQTAAMAAVEIAVEKAKKYGVSAVGVKNSNNFGTAGYFGDYAARQGMAAFIYANASPAIAPTGGNKTIFGTNPLCYAFPAGEGDDPIVLDMATSVVARGKVRLAAKNGEKIPTDWAIDKNGDPTDDPNAALEGSLLPIAGYKGYGLSMFVDLLAGALTGSAFAGGVKPLSDMKNDSGNGHLFVVIDTSRFMSPEELSDKMKMFCSAVRACGEEGKVMLPGEPGYRKMAEQVTAVQLPEKQFADINELAEKLNVEERLEIV